MLGTKKLAKKLRKKYGEFDCIHIHGLNRFRGRLAAHLKTSHSRLAITVWGSELLRSSDRLLAEYKKYYNKADVISFENNDMLEEFERVYQYQGTKRYAITRFGDELLDALRNYPSKATEAFRLRYQITPDDIIVSVGYNRNPAHRHIDVIQQLVRLPEDVQKRMLLLLPMTYGPRDDAYLSALDDTIASFQGRAIKFEEYLSKEELADILVNAEFFIHAQPTDAQSMTLMEYLFTNTIVINGSWLKYSILNDHDVFLITYDHFDQLPEVLCNAIEKREKYVSLASLNREKIGKLFNWNSVRQQWLDLYQ